MSEINRTTEEEACTCSTWWVDVDPTSPTYGEEYDQGGGEREQRWSRDPDCPVHGGKQKDY